MYFNFLGGSALLHLLAAYPKVIAAFGVAATVGWLTVGPYTGLTAERGLRALEHRLASEEDLRLQHRAADQLLHAERTDSFDAIRHVLRECGYRCREVTPVSVISDPVLRQKVVAIAELDRAATIGRAELR